MRPGSKNAAEDPQCSCKTAESGALLHFPVPPTFPALPEPPHWKGEGYSRVSCPLKSCVFFLSNFEKQAGRASVKSTLMRQC